MVIDFKKLIDRHTLDYFYDNIKNKKMIAHTSVCLSPGKAEHIIHFSLPDKTNKEISIFFFCYAFI